MRRAADLQGLQANEASNTVLDMNDDVAGREARDFGDEVLEFPASLARADQAVTQNVLFGNECDVFGLEP